MKASHLVFSILACTLMIVSTGCGSVSAVNNPTITPSPTPIPASATAASRFIFGITVFETDTGYEGGIIDHSGLVTPITPFNDAGLGQNTVPQVIADPKGRFLYALNVGTQHGFSFNSPGIVQLQINQQTGVLTRIQGSPLVFSQIHDGSLVIDPAGLFLYQANQGVFDVYPIDQTSGLLGPTSSSTAASLGNLSAIDSDGRFLFNANETSVEALAIGAGGTLTLIQSPIPTGNSVAGQAEQLTVSSDNKFLYLLNRDNIAIFNISATGTLSPVTGSPFALEQGATGMGVTPDGRHLYIGFINPSGISVKGFTFDSAASTVSPIPNAILTDNAFSATIDASGEIAYISENKALSTYRIDSATGSLNKLSQAAQPISEASQSMVVVP